MGHTGRLAPPRDYRGWFGHPKEKNLNFFTSRFTLGVTEPPSWATPKAKPSNFFASLFALEGSRTTPCGPKGTTPKIIIIIIILKKILKIKNIYIYILWPCVVF